MRKVLKWTAIALGVLFVALQFYRPERTNPPIDESQSLFATVSVPPEVQAVLRRSCFDCHSHETRWPWYSHLAPALWLVANDVKNGRENLNFSEFGKYKALRAASKLDMICEEISDRKMPLPSYLITHPGARLSDEEIDLICDWVDSVRDTLMNGE